MYDIKDQKTKLVVAIEDPLVFKKIFLLLRHLK